MQAIRNIERDTASFAFSSVTIFSFYLHLQGWNPHIHKLFDQKEEKWFTDRLSGQASPVMSLFFL